MNEFFATYDIFLSSALDCLGYKIDCVDKSGGKRCCFYFVRDDGLDDSIQGYWAGQLRVEPKKLFSSLKNLKSRIYS